MNTNKKSFTDVTIWVRNDPQYTPVPFDYRPRLKYQAEYGQAASLDDCERIYRKAVADVKASLSDTEERNTALIQIRDDYEQIEWDRE